ncbi:YaaL family protein [Salibacterium sp. K-3]
MLFQKKKIRQSENERLVELIQRIKEDLDQYEHLVERSIDPSLDVQTELKRKRAKYIFLLKEARHRRINGYHQI